MADPIRTAVHGLHAWLIARSWNALIIGTVWWIGLLIIHVPWAPLWAVLGALLQFIPNFGAMLALVGAEIGALFSGEPIRMIYVLVLYAIIVTFDGFVLDPLLMKRAARVPIWASLLTPIVLGIIFPFWGVVISAPLLAIIFTFHAQHQRLLKPHP
jgi:predicted PurR-regulated permease PerM